MSARQAVERAAPAPSGGAGRAVGGRQLEGRKACADFIDIGGGEFGQWRGMIREPCADLAAECSEPARERCDQIEPANGAGAERDGQGLAVGVEAEKADRGVERN